MTGSHRTGTEAASDRTPEELRGDIGELRADLGDTVEELAHRVDVPSRVRAKREETTEQVQQQLTQARALVAEKAPAAQTAVREQPAIAGAIALVLSYLLVSRLRRRSAKRNRRATRKESHATR